MLYLLTSLSRSGRTIDRCLIGGVEKARPSSLPQTILSLLLFPASAMAQVPGRASVENAGPDNTLGTLSDAEIWRSIRQGTDALPSGSRPNTEDGILINAQGEWWAQIHTDQIIGYGAWVLLAVILAISVYFIIRGKVRLEGGRTGHGVPRFNLFQRVAHWFMASIFLLLALTGIILLFGRTYMMPLVGHSVFSEIATAAMQAHNLFGPLFLLALVTLFIAFVRGNFASLVDLRWLLRAGGFFGGHASAGRYNLGEKLWFWVAVIGGLLLSVSGFLMLFPDTLATRDQLQLGIIVHAVTAILFIGVACGHIYLGTIGTEDTLEGMVHGDVDENWAKTHHDLWYENLASQASEKDP